MRIELSIQIRWKSEEETGQRGCQEANGNSEDITGLYGKEWSLSACDYRCSSNVACMAGLQRKALLKKGHVKSHLSFVKTHLEDSEAKGKEALWSDETKTELFGLNAEQCIWWKSNTAHHPKNTMVGKGGAASCCCGGVSLQLWRLEHLSGEKKKWIGQNIIKFFR